MSPNVTECCAVTRNRTALNADAFTEYFSLTCSLGPRYGVLTPGRIRATGVRMFKHLWFVVQLNIIEIVEFVLATLAGATLCAAVAVMFYGLTA